MQYKRESCLVLGSSARSFCSSREDLIKSLSHKDLDLILCSSAHNLGDLDCFNNVKNIEYKAIHLSRNGLNVFDDIKTFFNIFSLTKSVKPGFILAYGIKLVIWGGLSVRVNHTPFFALITGLGFAFQGDSFKRKFLTKLVVFLYKISLKNSKVVIFQNTDNRDEFVNRGIVELSKTFVVNGSGVDLKNYNVENLPNSSIRFLCLARLLGEKGLREYAKAAKIVKNKFPNVEFDLVGPEDSSPDAILLNEVDSWSDYINYKGSTDDLLKTT
jgi:glycosyltransferase involved in cell wall biosynthesis